MKNKIFFGTFLVALTACTFFYFNKIKKPQPSLTAYEQYLADHFYNKAAENIAIVIFNLLRPHLEIKLDLQVRLYETPRNFVDYPA